MNAGLIEYSEMDGLVRPGAADAAAMLLHRDGAYVEEAGPRRGDAGDGALAQAPPESKNPRHQGMEASIFQFRRPKH